ncbi:Protein FAR-RED IMPAIRED RESPONSE 1 [Linum perenne]
MREEFSVFGDSISFDTTYRTNKDYRPLALFVEYNHHRDMVIFGAALLFDEMTATSEWLFQMFDKCMGGRNQRVSSQTKQQRLLPVLGPYTPCQLHTMVCVHSTY